MNMKCEMCNKISVFIPQLWNSIYIWSLTWTQRLEPHKLYTKCTLRCEIVGRQKTFLLSNYLLVPWSRSMMCVTMYKHILCSIFVCTSYQTRVPARATNIMLSLWISTWIWIDQTNKKAYMPVWVCVIKTISFSRIVVISLLVQSLCSFMKMFIYM